MSPDGRAQLAAAIRRGINAAKEKSHVGLPISARVVAMTSDAEKIAATAERLFIADLSGLDEWPGDDAVQVSAEESLRAAAMFWRCASRVLSEASRPAPRPLPTSAPLPGRSR